MVPFQCNLCPSGNIMGRIPWVCTKWQDHEIMEYICHANNLDSFWNRKSSTVAFSGFQLKKRSKEHGNKSGRSTQNAIYYSADWTIPTQQWVRNDFCHSNVGQINRSRSICGPCSIGSVSKNLVYYHKHHPSRSWRLEDCIRAYQCNTIYLEILVLAPALWKDYISR